MFLVSLFFILFCCTSTSAQILISENLPFCDMTKTPNLIDTHRSCHHSRKNPRRPPFFKLRVYKKWNDPDEYENSTNYADVPSPILEHQCNCASNKQNPWHRLAMSYVQDVYHLLQNIPQRRINLK